MHRRSLIYLGSLALLLAACYPQTPPGPTETPTSSAALTPASAVASPTPIVVAGPIKPAPEALTQLNYSAGQRVDGPGLYLLDVKTGAVEGWTLSDAPETVRYTVSDDNALVIATTQRQGLAVHRKSGASYRWNRMEAELVTAAAPYLVFQEIIGTESSPLGTGNLIVVDMQLQYVADVSISAAGDPVQARGVLLPEHQRLFVVNGWHSYDSNQPADLNIYMVDLGNGAVRPIGRLAAPGDDQTIDTVILQSLKGGQEVAISTVLRRAYVPLEEAVQTTVVQRFTWEGMANGHMEVAGAAVRLAPDGATVAWEESLAQLSTAATVANFGSDEPLWRVNAATLCQEQVGLYLGQRWLANSSALLVGTRDGYGLVSLNGAWLDGGLLEKVDPATSLVPSPDNSNLVAVGGATVMDWSGTTIQSAAVSLGNRWRLAELAPWGWRGDEMRFAIEPLPGSGGACGQTGLVIPAEIVRPPFSSPSTLVVQGTEGCLNLRASPSLEAQIHECLPDGATLKIVQPPALPGFKPEGSLVYAEDNAWLYVRTQLGREGWVSFSTGFLVWPGQEEE